MIGRFMMWPLQFKLLKLYYKMIEKIKKFTIYKLVLRIGSQNLKSCDTDLLDLI